MVTVLEDIIELLVGGIQGIATGIGSGLQALAQNMFVTGSGTESDPYGLTIFGSLVAIFGGVALCISLSRLVFNWLISLGGKK